MNCRRYTEQDILQSTYALEPKENLLETLKQSNKPLQGGEITEISGLEKNG
jgi:hypothetical protein